jgi:hypothetical protein
MVIPRFSVCLLEEFDDQVSASHTRNPKDGRVGMEIWKALRVSHIPTPPDVRELTFPLGLLTVAGHVVVPVHERPLRIIPPGPDVEFEE